MALLPSEEDRLFGHILVDLRLATPEQIDRALAEQERLLATGVRRRLGLRLVESGVASAAQVAQALELPGKTLMVCGGCGKSFNMVGYRADRTSPCPDCGGALYVPGLAETLKANVAAARTQVLPAVPAAPHPLVAEVTTPATEIAPARARSAGEPPREAIPPCSGRAFGRQGPRKNDLRDDAAPLWAATLGNFARAVQLDPGGAEVRWHRGLLLHDMQRWSEAITDFEKALKRSPASEAHYRAQLGDARAHLAAATAGTTEPARPDSLRRGDAAIHAGDYAAARAVHEEGLAASAAALQARAEPDRARLLADPATRTSVLDAHYNLACILPRLGRPRRFARRERITSIVIAASPLTNREPPAAVPGR